MNGFWQQWAQMYGHMHPNQPGAFNPQSMPQGGFWPQWGRNFFGALHPQTGGNLPPMQAPQVQTGGALPPMQAPQVQTGGALPPMQQGGYNAGIVPPGMGQPAPRPFPRPVFQQPAYGPRGPSSTAY